MTLLLFMTFSVEAYAAWCKEPALGYYRFDNPMCRFFRGTRLYREQRFSEASIQWQAILKDRHFPVEFEPLRYDAMNNVGYLYYMGLGVKADRNRAVDEFWRPAHKAGHEEATFHLCHVYADEQSPLALGYCREALRRYKAI
ncbi:hypothetical protein [Leeia sp.]|uniref:hypothetical protein n=1 Tax=Leeia sp. TaxID=2884678 RepID=UPI0035B123B9